MQGPGEGDSSSFPGLEMEQENSQRTICQTIAVNEHFGWLYLPISSQGSHEGAGKAVGIPSPLHEFQAQTIDLHR